MMVKGARASLNAGDNKRFQKALDELKAVATPLQYTEAIDCLNMDWVMPQFDTGALASVSVSCWRPWSEPERCD